MFNKSWPEEEPKEPCGCTNVSYCERHYQEFVNRIKSHQRNYYTSSSTAATTYGELERGQEIWWRNNNG